VDPVSDPLLFRNSGSVAGPLDLWPGTLATRPQRRSRIPTTRRYMREDGNTHNQGPDFDDLKIS
jgi:hypothetical protein